MTSASDSAACAAAGQGTQPLAAATEAASADTPLLLPADTWQQLDSSHVARADALSAGHRARKARGEKHPIEDFLWTYYSVTPAILRRWHPGPARKLGDAASSPQAGWRYYRLTSAGTCEIDYAGFFAKRAGTVVYVANLLRQTLAKQPQFTCFGLHEWAMVYHLRQEDIRHSQLPLRIGHEATDAVVESHQITCSHFDAFRFFTPDAVPLNRLQPTRETQPDMEQSACLHAGMDVYKWASKLGPLIPGELLLDSFELARDIREVDMQASPYDVRGIVGHTGEPLPAIPIETAEGKREYVRRQREFASRGDVLRRRVLAAIAAGVRDAVAQGVSIPAELLREAR